MKPKEFTALDYSGTRRRFRVDLSDLVEVDDKLFFRKAEICEEETTELGVERTWKAVETAAVIDNGQKRFVYYVSMYEGGCSLLSTEYDASLLAKLKDAGIRVVNASSLHEKKERFSIQEAVNKIPLDDRTSLAILIAATVRGIRPSRQDKIYSLDGYPVQFSFLGYGPTLVENILDFAKKSRELDKLLHLIAPHGNALELFRDFLERNRLLFSGDKGKPSRLN